MAEREDVEDDEHRKIISNQYALEYQAQQWTENEEFKERLAQFKEIKVMKYGKFLQALFYLLEYKWDNIVETGTQKFNWKTSKSMLNDKFIEKMEQYQCMGPKEGSYTKYQTINYIESLLEGIEPQ